MTDLMNQTIRNPSIMGEACTYIPETGSPYPVNGVFEDRFQSVSNDQTGADVASTKPKLGVRLADLVASPTNKDKVTARGVTYEVIEPRPDEQGWVVLVLNEVDS